MITVSKPFRKVADPGGRLLWAAERGYSGLVEMKEGGNVRMFPYSDERYGDLALRLAAENGHEEVVKVLAAAVDIHRSDDAALRVASKNGQLWTVNILLALGAEIHARDEEALRMATRGGHAQTVEMLLARGANVRARNDEALRETVEGEHLDIVKLLLHAGADVNADVLLLAQRTGERSERSGRYEILSELQWFARERARHTPPVSGPAP